MTQFQGHFQDIKTKNGTTIARHFNRCPHDKPDLFDGIRISILSMICNSTDSTVSQRERDLEEQRWMHRLGEMSKFQKCGHQFAAEVGNKW